MQFTISIRAGDIFDIEDKKTVEAIVYNTSPWVFAEGGEALVRTWDICSIEANDDEAKEALTKIATEGSDELGHPLIAG